MHIRYAFTLKLMSESILNYLIEAALIGCVAYAQTPDGFPFNASYKMACPLTAQFISSV